jgi:murein DD-endopeptidase MepM/ murein hydrolase activator NlpD
MVNTFTISDKVKIRPGTNGNQYIPDVLFTEFWNKFYLELRNTNGIKAPIDEQGFTINPFFGYFGFRFHPIKFKPGYFHIGIDIDLPIGKNIYPISDGIFEYSGHGVENGNYFMISHPQYQTRDGYVLYSLYMHLQKSLISFTYLQKILRSAGFAELTDRKIKSNEVIALSGDSGNSKGIFPHLHLQLEFRNKKSNKIILIDPVVALGQPMHENLTKDIKGFNEFKEFYFNNMNELANWSPLINDYENHNYTP